MSDPPQWLVDMGDRLLGPSNPLAPPPVEEAPEEERKYLTGEDRPFHNCDYKECGASWRCETTWINENGHYFCDCKCQEVVHTAGNNAGYLAFWCDDICRDLDSGILCPTCLSELDDVLSCPVCRVLRRTPA